MPSPETAPPITQQPPPPPLEPVHTLPIPVPDNEDPLRLALSMVESLRAENDLYQVNFNKLRNAHEQLQETLAGVARERDDAVNQRRAMEDARAELKISHKMQLDEKVREIDDLKATLGDGRRDEEILRQRLFREWDEGARKRTRALEDDCQGYRQALLALRREHEMLKVGMEQQASLHAADLEQIKVIQDQETREFQEKMVALQENLLAVADTERLRAFQRENAEMQVRCRNLVAENEEIRALKEAALLECASLDRTASRRLADADSAARELAHEADELRGRLKLAEADADAATRALEVCREERDKAAREAEAARVAGEEAAHKFMVDLEEARIAGLKERQQLEGALAGAKQRVRELEGSLKIAESRLAEARAQSATADRDHVDRLKAAVQDERGKRDAVEDQKREVEKKLAMLERAAAEKETKDASVIKELRIELSHLQSSHATALDNMTSLQREVRELRGTNDRLEGAAKEARVIDEERKRRLAEVEEEVENGKREEEGLRRKILALESTIQSLEKESALSAREEDKLQHEWTRERAELLQQVAALRGDNDTLADKLSGVVTTFEKHHALYKSKYAELKKRWKVASVQCEALHVERDALAREVAECATRVREREVEQERNRTRFLALLQDHVAV
ncbi:hypothetical protein M427DRAFT_73472 [Gonapodya prolifera JEL478]|uniref:Uncharacterized protein n=1 Tax=Gonapodya prolifera (strain JEL478) TaxID=1344416 RepID=A0A139A269_GONPJ|nr:hypothetical protein M427DRAFT_73472 [Gonapodya prolifera JEL478]|eukprot:KXS10890.1 hypothetical protein M427DRAFT_73472 [Gonapodya prolifera JEL478]